MVRNPRSARSGNDAAADWGVRIVFDDLRAEGVAPFENIVAVMLIILQTLHIVYSMR